MKFQLQYVQEPYKRSFQTVLEYLGEKIGEEGMEIHTALHPEPVLTARTENGKLYLTGQKQVHLLRGLSLFLQSPGSETEIKEQICFSNATLMLDCSRNGVRAAEELKQEMIAYAALGLDQIMLYIEDIYEISANPYFGAFRGRYQKEEIKELDAFAAELGIELIPCVQTLAHLRTFLRWPKMRELCDIGDILLAEDEKVKALLEQMIESLSGMFSSRKIHLGMDEAFQLGLGQYLRRHGFQDRFQIMKRHLELVTGICRKYEMEPMIWSDMYIQLLSPTGEYYNVPMDMKTEELVEIPKGLRLVYWDYYNHDKNIYKNCIRFHKRLTGLVTYAAGGWTWNGVAPNYGKAAATMQTGMQAAKEEGVQDVICTLWYDNGAETPAGCEIYSAAYFAQLCYHETVGKEELNAWLQQWTGYTAKEWELLNRFDQTPGVKEDNRDACNPSKYLLYQDVLTGLFDKQTEGLEMSVHYGELAEKLQELLKRERRITEERCPVRNRHFGYYEKLFQYYLTLARLLEMKAEMGIKLYQAYQEENKGALSALEMMLGDCANFTLELKEQRQELWFMEAKAFGFECLDIRFGGLAARLKSAQKRIRNYLDEKISRIEELEEERICYQPMEEGESQRLCRCNLWEEIVTAGNISGV